MPLLDSQQIFLLSQSSLFSNDTSTLDEESLRRQLQHQETLRYAKMLNNHNAGIRPRLPPRSMSSFAFSMSSDDDLTQTTEDETMEPSFHHEIYSPHYPGINLKTKPTTTKPKPPLVKKESNPRLTVEITNNPRPTLVKKESNPRLTLEIKSPCFSRVKSPPVISTSKIRGAGGMTRKKTATSCPSLSTLSKRNNNNKSNTTLTESTQNQSWWNLDATDTSTSASAAPVLLGRPMYSSPRRRCRSPRKSRSNDSNPTSRSSSTHSTSSAPNKPFRQPSPRQRRSQSPRTPRFLHGTGSLPKFMVGDDYVVAGKENNPNDKDEEADGSGLPQLESTISARRKLYAAARSKCIEQSSKTLPADNRTSSKAELSTLRQQYTAARAKSLEMSSTSLATDIISVEPTILDKRTAKLLQHQRRSSKRLLREQNDSDQPSRPVNTKQGSSRKLQADNEVLPNGSTSSKSLLVNHKQGSSRRLQNDCDANQEQYFKTSSHKSSRQHHGDRTNRKVPSSPKRKDSSPQRLDFQRTSSKRLLEKDGEFLCYEVFESERTTPAKDVQNTKEECVHTTPTRESQHDALTTSDPTANTTKAKSILKAGDSEPPPIAVRSGVAAVYDEKPPDIQGTIIIRHDDSDEVTCLTMEDFKRQKSRLRRTSRKNMSHLAGIGESEHSSSHQRDGLSDASLAQILRKDIYSKKDSVLIAGLDAIREFANRGSKQRAKLCAFGAIPSILHVMDSKRAMTRNVLLSAFRALEKMTAKDVSSQEAACDLGAIATIALAVQLDFSQKDLVLAACKTLERITSCMRLSYQDAADDNDKHQDVITQGAITVLSCCLMTHPKDKDILAYGTGAITNLCMYRAAQIKLLSESGGITAMKTAVKRRKWKSKTRQKQAAQDLEVIVESAGFLTNDDIVCGSEEDEDESSSESNEEDEADEERSFSSC